MITKNPKLQTAFVRKTEGEYAVEHLVGAIALPEAAEGEPPTQVMTVMGPVDAYDSLNEVLKKWDEALEKKK